MLSSSSRDRRPALVFRCTECGWQTGKWLGRCGECQAWGTVGEAGGADPRSMRAGPVTVPARPIGDVDSEAAQARPTTLAELDRVLGGGLVPGAVLLLAGEPGVGKSTLLLDVAARFAGTSRAVLYVTGEESAAQVRLRAGRIGALHPRLYLAAENDLAAVLGQLEAVSPELLVVDSVQAIAAAQVDGTPGGVTQVREVAQVLIRAAKQRGVPVVLVGHVTKDGAIAGPRLLEHLVDVVLHFEGDRHSRLRMIRAVKNRYGPSDEVGCFELGEDGIKGVPDPSGMFVSRHLIPVPGTCVTVTVEGRRPLLVEVQALVGPSAAPSPRRATNGLDSSRVAMILAVLARRGRLRLADQEVFAATVGGARIGEPASDLAIALAVASATSDLVLPVDLVALGEVGLAGEVRRVSALPQRLAEAHRMGFRKALVPPRAGPVPDGMKVVEVSDICAALGRLGGGPMNVTNATPLTAFGATMGILPG